jgi:hypothetical protein
VNAKPHAENRPLTFASFDRPPPPNSIQTMASSSLGASRSTTPNRQEG